MHDGMKPAAPAEAGRPEPFPSLGTGYEVERTPSGRTWLRRGTVMLGYVEYAPAIQAWRAYRATGLPLKSAPRADARGLYLSRDPALADIAHDDEAHLGARAARDGSAS